MGRLSEQAGIVHVLEPADYQAGVDGDSFSLAKYRRTAIIFSFGAITGDAVLKVYTGASNGTKTTAETFKYRLADADYNVAASDGYGDVTSSAALTLTAATYDHKILVVEFDSDQFTDSQPWVTVELSAAASALTLAVIAILQEPRYSAHDMPTALA
jgi:hypothetical protein